MSDSKPPWVTTISGTPEAFKPLDKAEAEKLALAAIADAQAWSESPAAHLMSKEQRFLANAERRRVTTGAQLTLAPMLRENPDGWKEQIIQHVRALRDLGRFGEARAVIAGAPFDLSALLADVNETEAACSRPDDFDCGCEREVTTDEKGQPVILDRRFVKREFTVCPYRGEVKPLSECRHCGKQSIGIPERQAEYSNLRRQHELSVKAAIVNGHPVPNPKPDHQILK